MLNSDRVISLDLANDNLGPLGCKQIQQLLAISDKLLKRCNLRRLNLADLIIVFEMKV